MTELSSLPNYGAYQVVYADPPWAYNDKAAAGKRGAAFKYDVLSTHGISRMDVDQLAAPDAALFLWATAPMIDDALTVLSAWGFKYKTFAFNWVKTNLKKDTHFMGMGHWTRANAEVCLIGVRGKIKRINAGVSQVIRRPRLAHSEKPPEIRERIVQLMGDVPRVELFARQAAEGWDRWGLESPE